jgi:hypothetical protein
VMLTIRRDILFPGFPGRIHKRYREIPRILA